MRKYKPRTMLHSFEYLCHFVRLPLKIREKIKATMTYYTLFYFFLLMVWPQTGFGKKHTQSETVQLAFTFLMGFKMNNGKTSI